jgi:hypothetical protein
MVRLHTASGKSVVPYLVTGALLLSVVIVLVLRPWAAPATTSPEPTTSTSPSSEPSATSSPSATIDPGERTDSMTQPTGCLGGPDRTAASVLTAQAKAGHDSFGAVEVAAAFLRFFAQYPWPPTDQLDQAREAIASTAQPSFSDFAAAYASDGNNLVPAGLEGTDTSWQVTTVNGKWFLEETSPDRVNVQLAERYVINGASSTSALVTGVVMVWEDDAWHIEAGLPQDSDAIRDGGTYFEGGC